MLLPFSTEVMLEVIPCMIKEPSQQCDRSDKEWFAHSPPVKDCLTLLLSAYGNFLIDSRIQAAGPMTHSASHK